MVGGSSDKAYRLLSVAAPAESAQGCRPEGAPSVSDNWPADQLSLPVCTPASPGAVVGCSSVASVADPGWTMVESAKHGTACSKADCGPNAVCPWVVISEGVSLISANHAQSASAGPNKSWHQAVAPLPERS